MPETTGRTQRNVANMLVIVVGVILVALSMWGGSAAGVADTGETRASVPWLTHFSAGALAIAAVLIAQRWKLRRLGQACLLIGAAVLIGALLMFRYFGPWAWATLILPAVAMIAATPFLAPMPAPKPSTARQDTPAHGDNLP
jgi:peptidoglycan/LPS O-acetylase OafA/YrhL